MGATWYEIRVQQILDPDWAEWFEDMEILQTPEGETILAGWIIDQAALYGCFEKIRNLDLTLLSVNHGTPSDRPSARWGK